MHDNEELLFRGYVGPGGLGEGYPEAENCTGGMAGYIDRKFFGVNHIYGHPTSKVNIVEIFIVMKLILFVCF